MAYEVKEFNELEMRLLHFFMKMNDYNPIIMHGAKNETWLENLESEYSVVRIVTSYIHNDEQFSFDIFKTKQIVKKIKKKTMSFNLKTLCIYLNLGDNVHELKEKNDFGDVDCITINDINDIKKYDFIKKAFPNVEKEIKLEGNGVELITKILQDINEKSVEEANKSEDIFKQKKPIITYLLIALNIIAFIYTLFYCSGKIKPSSLVELGGLTLNHVTGVYGNLELHRLIISMFLHTSIFHLFMNMLSLYILGQQIENFYGKIKFLFIYLLSGIIGNLLSLLFIKSNIVSVGASGAVFGLMGALIFFGFHYRVYLSTVVRTQIIPIVILNLSCGFIIQGINNFAHIGGLVGGLLVSKALGVKFKSDTSDRVNGIIMTLILVGFLIYMIFFR